MAALRRRLPLAHLEVVPDHEDHLHLLVVVDVAVLGVVAGGAN